MNPLYPYLKSTIGFASKAIEAAFAKIDRADFVLDEYKNSAYMDFPLPIGFDATISQPTTVAFMINQLDPRRGNKILDVGSGSGWTTALLAHIVGEKGQVIGTEIIKELVEFGNQNVSKYEFSNAKILLTGKQLGSPKQAPFDPSIRSTRSGSTLSEAERVDRILVSAAAKELPQALTRQLKIGGVMVIPIGNSVWKITKVSPDEIEQKEYPGFAFVPLQ